MTMITIPMPPKPQSRPQSTIRRGRILVYEENPMTLYKRRVAGWVYESGVSKIVTGPVALTLRFYIAPPKYLAKVKKRQEALKNEQIYVDKKPDADNYVKAILDAINGIVYKDDGQVASLSAVKLYSYNPRTEIEVTVLEAEKRNDTDTTTNTSDKT
ncbi:RusA family crossover junction endodeoxyribonuclease [Enterococcus nangangensis]|uniref:RusA family crossover junction endodeoxyribonuclease n=1 Tax=Enterococcus nangangensis TaxID=2559926 RepID=UPI0010F79017|nr:RusA family crossover junction endodeoxyribonuclease [Enterococcus nangangensis]